MLLAGIALAVGLEGFRGSPGVLLLLATPLCWQASHLLVLKRLPGLSPPLLTGARYVFGSAILCLYWALRAGPATIPAADALGALAPVLVIQGLISFYFGTSVSVRRDRAARPRAHDGDRGALDSDPLARGELPAAGRGCFGARVDGDGAVRGRRVDLRDGAACGACGRGCARLAGAPRGAGGGGAAFGFEASLVGGGRRRGVGCGEWLAVPRIVARVPERGLAP